MRFTVKYQLMFSKYNHLYVEPKLFCGITEKTLSTAEIFGVVLTWIKAKKKFI